MNTQTPRGGQAFSRRAFAGLLTRSFAALSSGAAALGRLLPPGAAAGVCALAVRRTAAQRPSTRDHVEELADALDRLQVAEPLGDDSWAVYPLLFEGGDRLPGRWLTLDEALARGALVICEQQQPVVDGVLVENRSRGEYVLLTSGELLSGGKQTRTIARNAIVAPGRRVLVPVRCVEPHRWQGRDEFAAASAAAPPSLRRLLHGEADQQAVWEETARTAEALKAESPSGCLAAALESKQVQEPLGRLRRGIVGRLPEGAVGCVFVSRRRALGLELFGRASLFQSLFGKLFDAYAVEGVLLAAGAEGVVDPPHRPAVEFVERLYRAGSTRADTPGAGRGIATAALRLVGRGAGFDGRLAHFGVQPDTRWFPPPKPLPRPPIVPLPRPTPEER